MSVACGLDPASLLELDGRMIDALERAAARAWSTRYMLAAATIEKLDELRYLYVSVHARKGQRPTPVVKVPMPTDDDWLAPAAEPPIPRLSPAAFASQYGPRMREARA